MLRRLQNLVNILFQPLFLLLLIGFLVVGSITRKDNYLVIAKYTPDLLIFEGDLTKRSLVHNQYIMGLGHFGLGHFTEAEILFENILRLDAMRFGAKTHLNLLRSFYLGY